ncbi:MAG: elongation factor G [Planctomycetota bacterium]|nr:elongation factor G [Planctomycetota bacterium]
MTERVDRDLSLLRNFGIIAHIDAGKTTVTERILYYAHKEHRMGDVDEGTTAMDFMPEERARGITIKAAVTNIEWKGCEINLIDTPGHVDFTAEVERSLRVLDGAVVVFCGFGGVEAQSETVWRQADKYGIPRICFVNKLDRVGADFHDVVRQIREQLGARVAVTQIPIGEGQTFEGVIDLIRRKELRFDEESLGEKVVESGVAPERREAVEEARARLVETLAGEDDILGEKYVADQPISEDDIRAALRRQTIAVRLFPVLCGAAFRRIGIQPLMDAVVDYLPCPRESKKTVGVHPKSKKPVECLHYPDRPLAALAFKILADRHGDLTLMRLYSGKLAPGDKVYNSTRDRRERVGNMWRLHADSRSPVSLALPGDIVAVGGFKYTITGDTICDEDRPVVLETVKFPDTVISMAIEPKTNADKDKLAVALQKMAREDPTFACRFDAETGQTIVSGMGELHLEIIKHRMTREYLVEATIGKPKVSYRETIAGPAEAEGRFIQQTGGRGQYAICLLRVEPMENDEPGHIAFESKIVGGAIPKEYIASVERGARMAAESGVASGYPMIHVKVTLLDGKTHEVDSSPLAFEMAGSLAFKDACSKAGIVLLEPIMSLELVAPDEYLGGILRDLNARRAEIEDVGSRGNLRLVHAKVPLSEMFGYATVSRSLSSGRASYSLQPCAYAPVPKQRYEEILGRF